MQDLGVKQLGQDYKNKSNQKFKQNNTQDRQNRHKKPPGSTIGNKFDSQVTTGQATESKSMRGPSIDQMLRQLSSLASNQAIPESFYDNLATIESRSLSLLLKELGKGGQQRKAFRIFDDLRQKPEGSHLKSICDVYCYTAMVSICITNNDVDKAMQLVKDMEAQGIERNVHTFTALMNVCIKAGKSPLALETYNKMRREGCRPNVVTYNTLIDVYGKLGQWEKAIGVLDQMNHEGVEPVLRTYNTLIISCNMCNEPREALHIYEKMLSQGFQSNATTYNALICAYGKTGQLNKVLDVYKDMITHSCDRSVITYSSLISASEKAGQWQLALEFFNLMHKEGCMPNTVTYNSLITACGQGGQWQPAELVFKQMCRTPCTPDVVTYTALISAYEKGGQWQKALEAFQCMQAASCRPDSIVYNAIVDALWETGVLWAQRKALKIFLTAQKEKHFEQSPISRGQLRYEVNLHAMTAGVAVLSLYTWLLELREVLQQYSGDEDDIPGEVVIVSDKGKSSREQGNVVVKEAVGSVMSAWSAPFKAVDNSVPPAQIEASCSAVWKWMNSRDFDKRMLDFFPSVPATTLPTLQQVVMSGQDPPLDPALTASTNDAFSAMLALEQQVTLTVQQLPSDYVKQREEVAGQALALVAALGLHEVVAHDAVQLLDRTMAASVSRDVPIPSQRAKDILYAAILIAASSNGQNKQQLSLNIEQATGSSAQAITSSEQDILVLLDSQTASISTARVLQLFLDHLAAGLGHNDATVQSLSGHVHSLARAALMETDLLQIRPSVAATAMLYVERRSRGAIPFLPTAISKATGHHEREARTPDLPPAIAIAQRLATSALPYSLTASARQSIIRYSSSGNLLPGLSKRASSYHSLLTGGAGGPNAHVQPAPTGSLNATYTPQMSLSGSSNVLPGLAGSMGGLGGGSGASQTATLLAMMQGSQSTGHLPLLHNQAMNNQLTLAQPQVGGLGGANSSGGSMYASQVAQLQAAGVGGARDLDQLNTLQVLRYLNNLNDAAVDQQLRASLSHSSLPDLSAALGAMNLGGSVTPGLPSQLPRADASSDALNALAQSAAFAAGYGGMWGGNAGAGGGRLAKVASHAGLDMLTVGGANWHTQGLASTGINSQSTGDLASLLLNQTGSNGLPNQLHNGANFEQLGRQVAGQLLRRNNQNMHVQQANASHALHLQPDSSGLPGLPMAPIPGQQMIQGHMGGVGGGANAGLPGVASLPASKMELLQRLSCQGLVDQQAGQNLSFLQGLTSNGGVDLQGQGAASGVDWLSMQQAMAGGGMGVDVGNIGQSVGGLGQNTGGLGQAVGSMGNMAGLMGAMRGVGGVQPGGLHDLTNTMVSTGVPINTASNGMSSGFLAPPYNVNNSDLQVLLNGR